MKITVVHNGAAKTRRLPVFTGAARALITVLIAVSVLIILSIYRR